MEEYQLSTALTLGLAFSSSTPSTTTNRCPQDQVSTALVLCDPTWNYTRNKRKASELDPAPHELSIAVPPNPKREKKSAKNCIGKELMNKEKRNRAVPDTTLSSLSIDKEFKNKVKRNRAMPETTTPSLEPRGPWKIRKRLTVTDLGNCSRLLMPKNAVIEHVMHYLDDKFAERVESGEGAEVIVQDCDTNSGYQLTLKYWSSAKCYILNGDWRRVFVHRRGLKENDQIGLCWDASKSMLMFSLLERAKPIGQPAAARI